MLDIPWLLHNVIHVVENHYWARMEQTSRNNYWSCQHRGVQACLEGPGQSPLRIWTFFLFLCHQHKFTALFFSAHSTSTAHICWRWAVLPFADQTFRFLDFRIDLHSFYLLIFYHEKFWNWIWRFSFVVNVILNQSLLSVRTGSELTTLNVTSCSICAMLFSFVVNVILNLFTVSAHWIGSHHHKLY